MSVLFLAIIPMFILFCRIPNDSSEIRALRESQIQRLSVKALETMEWSDRQDELMEWNTRNETVRNDS